MPFDPAHVRDAARLLAFALMPQSRPTNDPEYARLINAYLDGADVANAAREICAGLGLRLLDVSDYGAVVAASSDSPFGLTLANYKDNLSGDERLLHGLVHVAIAAYLYPRAEDLESEADIRQVSIAGLEPFIREACEAAVRASPEQKDAPVEYPDLESAFRTYLRWPATRETQDGRRSAKTTQGIIANVLEKLTDHGLLQRVSGEADTYRALRRYRVQVRELAAHKALDMLRKARGG